LISPNDWLDDLCKQVSDQFELEDSSFFVCLFSASQNAALLLMQQQRE